MVTVTKESVVVPLAQDETIEYDNRIEDVIEIDPEDEEPECDASYTTSEQMEQQFARYERNYRARRIRELTLSPVVRRRGRPSGRHRSTSIG